MSRNKDEFLALPTAKMRGKIWARVIKKDLLPGSDENQQLAHQMNDALLKKAGSMKFRSEMDRKDALESIATDGGKFISDARWYAWWRGGKPSPEKIRVLNKIIPGSKDWFLPHIGKGGDHPLHTLLFCVDMLGKSSDINQATEAIMTLAWLQTKWGPKAEYRKGVFSHWSLYQLPEIALDSAFIMDHYQIFSPVSIIELMLWVGDDIRIKDTSHHQEWMFDMVSASICVSTLFHAYPAKSSWLGGKDADISTFIYRMFIQKVDFFSSANGLQKYKDNIFLVNEDDQNTLPRSEYFIDLIKYSVNRFGDDMKRFGLDPMEISKIDSQLTVTKKIDSLRKKHP